MTKTRIRIPDNTELRARLDQEYEDASQVQLCRYALMLAAHILKLIDGSKLNHDTIKEGFWINEQWQEGSEICETLKEKFGEKNPDVKV